MSFVTINGNKYQIPEVNFDAICELEENGVQMIGADRRNMKLMTTIRGIAAWIMGTDTHTASKELEAHIINGGDATEIITAFMAEAENAGFFGNRNRQRRQQNQQKVTNLGGHNKKRGNGNPSQR